MTSSTCPQIRPRLVAAAKGELPELEQQLVDAHLARCESCASVERTLRLGLTAASFEREATDPSHLVDLMTQQRRRRARTFVAAGSAMALAASVAIIALATTTKTQQPQTEQPVAIAPAPPPAPPPAPVVDEDVIERTTPTPHLRLVARSGWRGSVARDGALTEVQLTQGSLAFAFQGGEGRKLVVRTPAGVIDVVGTRFSVDVVDGGLAVAVQSGTVKLDGQPVAKGQRVTKGNAPAPSSLVDDPFLDVLHDEKPQQAEKKEEKKQKAAAPAPSRQQLGVLLDELARAERLLRQGKRSEGLAVFDALRADPQNARQRDVIDFEEATLRDGDSDMAGEAALKLCELDLQRAPCAAAKCLEDLDNASSRRLLDRSQARARCDAAP